MKHFETNLEIEEEYPKLVRDKIPELIKKWKGRTPETRFLQEDREYEAFLFKKLIEEANELVSTNDEEHLKEEIVDVMEVLDEILKLQKISLEEIRSGQEEKREERGGFQKRILILEKV